MRDQFRNLWFAVMGAICLLVTVIFCAEQAFSATKVFTSQAAFNAATGAEALEFPDVADTAYPDKPFGTALEDYSCVNTPPGIALPFGAAVARAIVLAPNALVSDDGHKWICFIGPGWNAGTGNINPTPVSPTIVANGEDDFEIAFAPAVYAVGFELLTNSSAMETVTLTFADGSTDVVSPAVLYTSPNRFEFVGFRSLKPIVKVRIETTNGAVQNEGIAAIATAEYYKVQVDIKPCSFPNSINLKSKGKIPVAILSTHQFDATKVVPPTVRLAGVPPLMWSYENAGRECGHADGFRDLVLHFETEEIAEAIAAMPSLPTRLELTGYTMNDVPIRGSDSIRIVPSNHKK
jgi:hypothetical protein